MGALSGERVSDLIKPLGSSAASLPASERPDNALQGRCGDRALAARKPAICGSNSATIRPRQRHYQAVEVVCTG
jgi:hypothetical protein